MDKDNHGTNQDKTPTRIDRGPRQPGSVYNQPELRPLGVRAKREAVKLGITLSELYTRVESKLKSEAKLRKSSEVVAHILNGRRDRNYEAVFNCIAEIFAELNLYRDGIASTHDEIAARAAQYRRVIYGEEPSTPTLQLDSLGMLAPSFEQLAVLPEPTESADRFLDAMPPTLSDIAAGFDIDRTVFVERGGIRDTVLKWLSTSTVPLLVSMSGQSGTGKTVLSTRLAYECIQKDFQVFRLLPDWLCSDSLGIQIKRLLEVDKRPHLFIFDNAGTLIRKGVKPLDIFRTVQPVKCPCVLLFSENWRLFSPVEISESQLNANEMKHFSISPLTSTELRALLDRIVDLETTDRVREVRCQLSKESRLALCVDDRDRLVAAALLIFRYGRRVADILVDEFNGISDAAVKQAYINVVVCSGLGLGIPKSLITKMLKTRGVPRSADLWRSLFQLVAETEGTVSLRHPRFFQHLAPAIIPNPNDRADLLADLISESDENENEELDFVLDVFSRRKSLMFLLQRDRPAIRQWVSRLAHLIARMPSIWQRNGYVCLGQIEQDTLWDLDKANDFFKSAIASDPTFAFAYRQRSWNRLRARKPTEAEQSAIEAAEKFPHDAKTVFESASVLQYCSLKGFRRAGSLFGDAQKLAEDDPDLMRDIEKRFARYQDANNVLKHFVGAKDMPECVLAELNTPSYVWELKGAVQRALKGELGSFLRDSELDTDGIEDTLNRVEKSAQRDAVLDALTRANIARLEYQQWYHANKSSDFDMIEDLFLKALDKLTGKRDEPFVRTWYGTFLKEARRNCTAAEQHYRTAIQNAEQFQDRDGQHPMHNEPMLLNNLALLLMHSARIGTHPRSVLDEAERLLDNAMDEVNRRKSKFFWPSDTAAELKLLKAEMQ